MAKFVDPLDEEADEAGAKSAEKYAGKLAERLEAREPAEDETEEVEVQEPEEPEDEEEAKPSRKDKRASRMSARERAAAAEARAQTLQEQLDITRRGQAERGDVPRQPQGNPVAGIDARISTVYERQKQLNAEYNAAKNLTAAQEKEYYDRAVALDVEKTSLIAERRDVLTAPERQRKAHMDMLASRAPDVYQDPRAFQYAQAVYNQHLARGEKDTIELHDLAMEEARQAILGKRPKPDAGQRQRAAGMGGGTRAASGPEAAPKISMPKGSALWRMAVATYPDLDPGEACQKWANKNGKAYVGLAARRRA